MFAECIYIETEYLPGMSRFGPAVRVRLGTSPDCTAETPIALNWDSSISVAKNHQAAAELRAAMVFGRGEFVLVGAAPKRNGYVVLAKKKEA